MSGKKVSWAALAVLVFWQILAWIVNLDILPPPWLVLQSFFSEITGDLGWHFAASLWRVLASMLVSIALAAPAGLLLGQSKRLNELIAPVIYLVYPVPKVVLVPVVLLFLGINDLSKIVIIFLILFFQILVVVRDQAASITPELMYSVRSLGAGRRGLFRFVYLPASVPAILTGHSTARAIPSAINSVLAASMPRPPSLPHSPGRLSALKSVSKAAPTQIFPYPTTPCRGSATPLPLPAISTSNLWKSILRLPTIHTGPISRLN